MDIYEEELYEYEKALKKMAAEGGEGSTNLKASPAIPPTYSTLDPV